MARCSGCKPLVPDSPSTVVTVLPATVAASREQEYSGLPSISTMQAPHCSVPQPNLLPRSASSSRSTLSNGVVPSHVMDTAQPLTVNVIGSLMRGLPPAATLPVQASLLDLDAFGVDEPRPVL